MDRELLLKELERDEGLRLRPYRCPAGRLTIGIGRNLDDKGISRGEAYYLACNDVEECEEDLRELFPVIWPTFSGDRQRALANMRFNLGPHGFRGFHGMIAAIRSGKWQLVAEHAEASHWYHQVGKRAERIVAMLRDG
jgi:lysozyme